MARKSNKKLTATQRLRKNIREVIRYREKQGFEFSEELKENISTKGYQYLKSLQNKGYKKLYSFVTVKPETAEKVSGRGYRVKQPVPNEIPTQEEGYSPEDLIDNEEGFEDFIKDEDYYILRLLDIPEYFAKFQEGKIIMEQARSTVQGEVAGMSRASVKRWVELLDRLIEQYGIERVAIAIQENAGVFELASNKMWYYPPSHSIQEDGFAQLESGVMGEILEISEIMNIVESYFGEEDAES